MILIFVIIIIIIANIHRSGSNHNKIILMDVHAIWSGNSN